MYARSICSFSISVLLLASVSSADQFQLLTGVDPTLYPAVGRSVAPVPGFGIPGTFYDGDRLAGTSDVGPTVAFQGSGTPLFAPNQFGSLSFMFKRGTIPAGGPVIPFLGIDFLGGPRLDLDGSLDNDTRSLVPVADEVATPIPNSASFIELDFDLDAGLLTLNNIDATATNETGPNVPAEVAVVVVTLAGTEPDGSLTDPINPSIDTRSGAITPYTGLSTMLTTVYRIEDLGYEFWQDTLHAGSSTASTLGTLQYLGTLSGWLVLREPDGQFPPLAGEGLGSTLWPSVDTSQAGQSFNTAQGLAGGSATITTGPGSDAYTAPNNGGLALTDFGGDLGAYFDQVVIPLVDPQANSFVYLEAAGFGINNSFDPVFTDTVSYDVVLIGQRCLSGNPDLTESGAVNAADLALLLGAWGSCDNPCCPADFTGDGTVNASDLAVLLGNWG